MILNKIHEKYQEYLEYPGRMLLYPAYSLVSRYAANVRDLTSVECILRDE
jgi:hypothetical protein